MDRIFISRRFSSGKTRRDGHAKDKRFRRTRILNRFFFADSIFYTERLFTSAIYPYFERVFHAALSSGRLINKETDETIEISASMSAKPTFEQLKSLCPDVEERFLSNHYERLSDRYYDQFSIEEIEEHVYGLYALDRNNPYNCIFSRTEDGLFHCTIIAFDHPSLFSLLTGALSAARFNILAGNIFTYTRKRTTNESRSHVHYPRRKQRGVGEASGLDDLTLRRKIIDSFTGTLPPATSFEQWKTRFTVMIGTIFSTLESNDPERLIHARRKVQELVAEALINESIDYSSALYPVTIEDASSTPERTRIKVVSEDTPFFLFSLSNALSLHDISIESVRIRTIDSKVEDDFEFVDLSGKPIDDEQRINQIKLSILFTKQFTFFLSRAPDPYRALVRFETIIQDISKLSQSDFQTELLSNPRILTDLARLLGASDFLWEDFIRLQYESLLPMLHMEKQRAPFSHKREENKRFLEERLSDVRAYGRAKEIINEFKDREIYLIDLDHILNPDIDFLALSKKLTDLAELIISSAITIAEKLLTEKYGQPRTVAGIPATYAVFGLGKMGGAALGYASDIELMFVYSDNGKTEGPEKIPNNEFFERLFREAVTLIEAKRQGIFRVDLRLRPYGSSGPLACSLENFFRYYGHEGTAHSFELLSLIRMRAIAGDRRLGEQIERLRDEMVYSAQRIDLRELRELRQKQLEEKAAGGRPNSKFSPGALVDLEYTVQILQCTYGTDNPALRTPRIHVALEELKNAGILDSKETGEIIESYHFFRKLINSLRMLRGSAEDLFLPSLDSDEYMHLARRAGYNWKEGLSPAQILHLEFETRTATIRRFVEQHLGRESLPGPPSGNAADLLLSTSLPESVQKKIIREGGLQNETRAMENITALGGIGEQRTLFARLAVLAWDILKNTPDPDMALNNWERFTQSLPSTSDHYRELLSQPKRLEIMLSIFSGSQFLADTLVRNPEFFEWVTEPGRIGSIRTREHIERDLRVIEAEHRGEREWLNALRRFRKREILRIGTRDISLKVPIQDIVEELSNLAEAIISVELVRLEKNYYETDEKGLYHFCVLAFGKLGGKELNYSSDIDLLGIFDPPRDKTSDDFYFDSRHICNKILEKLRSDLSEHTEEGYVYRVDLRLRPFGKAGLLVNSIESLTDYYEQSASLWEMQAALKLRPIAGSIETGEKFLKTIHHLLMREKKPEEVKHSIRHLRSQHLRSQTRLLSEGRNIKSGEGGIRDIEFLVQALQLIHCNRYPDIISGTTLTAINRLNSRGIIPTSTADQLASDYIFLRKLEHLLQIFEDRQVHTTPQSEEARKALAKRFQGSEKQPETLFRQLEETVKRVHTIFQSTIDSLS